MTRASESSRSDRFKRVAPDGLEGERNKMLCVRHQPYKKVTMYAMGNPAAYLVEDPTGQLAPFNGPVTEENARIIAAYDDFLSFWRENGHESITQLEIPNSEPVEDVVNRIERHAGEELIVVVYCGQAGGGNDSYRWVYPGCSQGGFDAWSLLRAARTVSSDIVFIIDAFLQNRFSRNLTRPPGEGNAEIFHRPAPMLVANTGGTQIIHPGHMLEALVRNLNKYIDHACGTYHTGPRNEAYSRRVEGGLLALNQITSDDKLMHSSFQHHLYNRPYGDNETTITRVKFDPIWTQATGKLGFCEEECQGPGHMKTRCNTANDLILELAKFSQRLYIQGEVPPEFAIDKRPLRPHIRLWRSFCNQGLFAFAKHSEDYSRVEFSGSESGLPDFALVRHGNYWSGESGVASATLPQIATETHLPVTEFAKRFEPFPEMSSDDDQDGSNGEEDEQEDAAEDDDDGGEHDGDNEDDDDIGNNNDDDNDEPSSPMVE